MKRIGSLSHSKWECKYHIVWIPKYRKKKLFGAIRKQLVDVLKRLANQKESTIIEGKLMSDHVHMLISIPPKYSVAQIVGFLKGKSAVYIAREISNYKNTKGHGFWARGYFVSTVGADENIIKSYIKHQEKEDIRQAQLELF